MALESEAKKGCAVIIGLSVWVGIGASVPFSWTWYIVLSIAALLIGYKVYAKATKSKHSEAPEGVQVTGGALGILLIIVLLARACGGCGDNETTTSQCKEWDLEYAAHEFVKRQLNHPKTASFSDMYGQDKAVVPSGSNKWMVMGKVESQNSFGVEITNFYTVELSCNPNTGDITLVDVSMSNN